MLSFIGDYTCKLDSKGRAVVPVVFRKEMQASKDDVKPTKDDVKPTKD